MTISRPEWQTGNLSHYFKMQPMKTKQMKLLKDISSNHQCCMSTKLNKNVFCGVYIDNVKGNYIHQYSVLNRPDGLWLRFKWSPCFFSIMPPWKCLFIFLTQISWITQIIGGFLLFSSWIGFVHFFYDYFLWLPNCTAMWSLTQRNAAGCTSQYLIGLSKRLMPL